MPSSLDSLNVELLDKILSFVQPRSTLYQLALVSWTLNSLATRHLYRHVFLDSDCPNGGIRHMLPFTFLILRKPCIASLVRSFTFRGRFHDENYSSSHPSERRLLWPKHPERDNILRRLIKKISHSEEEELEWHQAVLPGIAPQDDAICSLLLISLPNLRRLDFEITGYHVDFLTRIFSRIASSEPPFDVNPVFTKLSDIMLAGSNDRYSTDYVLLGACCTSQQ